MQELCNQMRPIAYQTYINFAEKYGIPIAGKSVKQLSKAILQYELKNYTKRGLYIFDRSKLSASDVKNTYYM